MVVVCVNVAMYISASPCQCCDTLYYDQCISYKFEKVAVRIG